MSDATVAAASSVAVAIITAVVGPAVLARYKLRRQAMLTGARRGRPSIPSRPGRATTARSSMVRLRALGLIPAGSEAPVRRVLLREGSPRAVLGRLAEIPPLSRRAVADELFVGRWAEWTGIVRDIRESASGYTVRVVDAEDGGAALLEFGADERPVLESLREGDAIRYLGRVTGAEDGVVILDSPSISRSEWRARN